MKAEEFILRFWALSQNMEQYKGSLASSINHFIETQNDSANIEFLEDVFIKTFDAVTRSFGEYSFMTFTKKNAEYQLLKFNAALFDAQMVGFYILNNKGINVDSNKANNLDKLFEVFRTDPEFIKSISQATGNKGAIIYRINKIVECFEN